MKNTLLNKLSSFQAALSVADDSDNQALWKGKSPKAFDAGMTTVHTAVAELSGHAASQSAPITGTAEALKKLRADFEAALHSLARATYRTLVKLGRTEDAAKVNLTPTDLHDARGTELATTGETVLDLAEALTTADTAIADDYGITPASVALVDDLWTRFSTAVGAPRGARSQRKAKTDSLPPKFAAVEELFSEQDDLIIQFNTTEPGQRFVEAWFNARQVVALGRRAAKPKTPASPTPEK